MKPRTALLLNGSPRRENSLALASYLSELLAEKGLECETMQAYRTPLNDLLSALEKAEVVVLSFPLYVDSLPGGLTQVLEEIARQFDGQGRSFAAVVNCGFPESGQAAVSLGIAESFARTVGFRWLGGLSMGAGPSMGGRPISECGGMLRNVIAGLKVAADDIVQGDEISDEAVRLVGMPLVPHLVYRLMAGQHFRTQAKKNGAKIYDRTYEWKRR